MSQSKTESQNLENVERMKTESQYLFENITDQVVDKLLDDIDISKVSSYPSLKELGKDYAENPDKLKKDIDELSNSQNLLDREDRNILETIKEKLKKPLAVVCLLGVLMTGGAMNDGDKDSNIHQLANKLGINNVAHAEEEVDWDSMMAEAQEGLEEDKEKSEKLKKENEELRKERKELEKKILTLKETLEEREKKDEEREKKDEEREKKNEEREKKNEEREKKYEEGKERLVKQIKEIIELSGKILEGEVEESTLNKLKKEEYHLLDQIERHNLGEDLKEEVEESIEEIENRL